MINDGDDARLELSLVKYAITVLLAMHWCGCVWGLVAETQRLDAMSSADADADADAAAAAAAAAAAQATTTMPAATRATRALACGRGSPRSRAERRAPTA